MPACAPTAVSEVLREALREPEALEVMGEAARARVWIVAFCRADTGCVPEALDLPRPSRLWPIGWFALGAATFWIQDLFI